MNRRHFLGSLAALSAGMALDPERLLWVPGRTTYFDIVRPAIVSPVTLTNEIIYELHGKWIAQTLPSPVSIFRIPVMEQFQVRWFPEDEAYTPEPPRFGTLDYRDSGKLDDKHRRIFLPA